MVNTEIGKMPSVDDIMRYEGGEMDQDEMVQFFQGMINTGTVWQLQGHYGRTAMSLIEAGLCTVPEPEEKSQ